MSRRSSSEFVPFSGTGHVLGGSGVGNASPSGQAHNDRVARRANAAATTIQQAWRGAQRRAQFRGVVAEAVGTRRDQLAAPLVPAPGNRIQGRSQTGQAAREYTTSASGMTQVALYNRHGNFSEQVDLLSHENGTSVSGHHHVAHTPGDIGSSRGRNPALFREAHYPAATMDSRVWTGHGVPAPATPPGTTGAHMPLQNLPNRTAQMGSLAASAHPPLDPGGNGRGGSDHAQQRTAYLSKL